MPFKALAYCEKAATLGQIGALNILDLGGGTAPSERIGRATTGKRSAFLRGDPEGAGRSEIVEGRGPNGSGHGWPDSVTSSQSFTCPS